MNKSLSEFLNHFKPVQVYALVQLINVQQSVKHTHNNTRGFDILCRKYLVEVDVFLAYRFHLPAWILFYGYSHSAPVGRIRLVSMVFAETQPDG